MKKFNFNGKDTIKFEKSDLNELKYKRINGKPFRIWRSQLDLSDFTKEDRNIFLKFLKGNDTLIEPKYGFVEFDRFNFRKEEVKDEVGIDVYFEVPRALMIGVDDHDLENELYGKLKKVEKTFFIGTVKIKGIVKRFQKLVRVARRDFVIKDLYSYYPTLDIEKWGLRSYGLEWDYSDLVFNDPYDLYENHRGYSPRLYTYNGKEVTPFQSFGSPYEGYLEIEEIINNEFKKGVESLLEENKDEVLSRIQKIKIEMDELVSEYAKKSKEVINKRLSESEKEVDEYIANFKSLEEVKIASRDDVTYDEVDELHGILPSGFIYYNHLGNYTFFAIAKEYEIKKVLNKNGDKYYYDFEVSKWKRVFKNPYDGIEEDYIKYKKFSDEVDNRDDSYGRAAFRHMLGNME